MRRLAFAVVVLVALTTPMLAQDAVPAFSEGWAALERGDYATALRVFKARAALRDAGAQINLGIMYDKGNGVPQDYAEAVEWYRLGAEQGYAKAQNNLGWMYNKGKGVPQDDVRVHMWSNLAAAQGVETARKNRDLLVGWMTPAQIAEAQEMAREWLEKHGQ